MRLKARWVQDRSCRRRGETSRQYLVWDVMDGAGMTLIRAQPWCVPFLRGERRRSMTFHVVSWHSCVYPRARACSEPGKVHRVRSLLYYAVCLVSASSSKMATNQGPLILIGHRETPLPIIPHTDVPCQVRPHIRLNPDLMRLSAYPIAFSTLF
jgi:hypothetical protein